MKAKARNEVNVRLGRKFEFGARRVEASVDVFNIFNGGAFERYRTDSNQLYNPFYLAAQNLQPPRVMQLSFKFLFYDVASAGASRPGVPYPVLT